MILPATSKPTMNQYSDSNDMIFSTEKSIFVIACVHMHLVCSHHVHMHQPYVILLFNPFLWYVLNVHFWGQNTGLYLSNYFSKEKTFQ